MNRKDELKHILTTALDTPKGVIYTVSGDEVGRRNLAISALITAKRELLPDIPEMINIVIKPVPNNADEIAIMRITPGELIEV